MPSIAGSFVAYKTIQLLAKPFKDWDAFKLGIIDKNGDTLKKAETAKEQASWDMFQIMIRNLKQLLAKFPFGKSRIASFAAALWLIKESQSDGSDDFERLMFEHLGIDTKSILMESDTSSRLAAGIYDFDDKTFIVKEDQAPLVTYIGQNIYKLQDTISKDYCHVTIENLIKYK